MSRAALFEVADAVVSLTTAGERISELHGRLTLAPVVGFGAVEFRRGWDMASRRYSAIGALLDGGFAKAIYCDNSIV